METTAKTRPDDQGSILAPVKKAVSAKARAAVLSLLAKRALAGSVCPSEVARAIGSTENWREAMPEVHAAVDDLLAESLISLSWKGKPLAQRDGPYRIRGQAHQ